MPIKRFPPPSFLPHANWQKKGSELMPVWVATSETLFEDAYQMGSISVGYLVLIYKLGVYQLWFYMDDCDDDPKSMLWIPEERELLWSGKDPAIGTLSMKASIYTDGKDLSYVFADDDYYHDIYGYAPDEF